MFRVLALLILLPTSYCFSQTANDNVKTITLTYRDNGTKQGVSSIEIRINKSGNEAIAWVHIEHGGVTYQMEKSLLQLKIKQADGVEEIVKLKKQLVESQAKFEVNSTIHLSYLGFTEIVQEINLINRRDLISNDDQPILDGTNWNLDVSGNTNGFGYRISSPFLDSEKRGLSAFVVVVNHILEAVGIDQKRLKIG